MHCTTERYQLPFLPLPYLNSKRIQFLSYIFSSSFLLNEAFFNFIFTFTNLAHVADDYYIHFALFFFCRIGTHLPIISIEMPQLGQLGPLMAVIASCFTNMSLIRLTVCLLLCCNPSILIKFELNDQWRLCVGNYHFRMLLKRNLQWLFTFLCSGS